jgi:hypothetical protein
LVRKRHRITAIEIRPISPLISSRTPLCDVQPARRPPFGLCVHADPSAFRLAEQLNRQIGVRIRHHIAKRPGDAMGPVRRSQHEDSGTFEDPAPSMIASFMRNQATPSPARAPLNQDRPCATRLVRTGNRVGSAASLTGSAKPWTSTARSRDSVSRTEQARDRRIAAVRRWIVDAVAQAK